MGRTPEELLFREREKRVHDAVALREPDRVPVMCHSGFFPAFYAGISCQEAMYDAEKVVTAWTEFLVDAFCLLGRERGLPAGNHRGYSPG